MKRARLQQPLPVVPSCDITMVVCAELWRYKHSELWHALLSQQEPDVRRMFDHHCSRVYADL